MSIFGRNKPTDSGDGVAGADGRAGAVDVKLIELFTESMNRLSENIEKQPAQVAQLVQAALTQNQAGQAGQAGQGSEPQEAKAAKVEEPVDLDSLTNTQLVGHIGKMLEERWGKPIMARLDEMGKSSIRDNRRQEFLHYNQRNPEFEKWAPELMEVLKKYPDLSPDDAHRLVRSLASADRLKEVEGVKEPEKPAEETPVLSFRPTALVKETDREDMTPQESSDEAFKRVFGNVENVV